MSERDDRGEEGGAEDPRRAEERALVRRDIEGQLLRRGVRAVGDETDDQIAQLLAAVEEFEAAVARAGGDSMVNAPDSSRPDDPQFVIPQRAGDESAARYISRIRDAALALHG